MFDEVLFEVDGFGGENWRVGFRRRFDGCSRGCWGLNGRCSVVGV